MEQENLQNNSQNNLGYREYLKTRKKQKKGILWIVLASIGGSILLIATIVGFFMLIFSTAKSTEEYKVAYSYLMQSEAFAEMGAEEEDVRLNSMSSTTYLGGTEEGYDAEAEVIFFVKNETAVVICHRAEGEWYVCEECTTFD